mgnify:CR=1 FL=1
MQISKLPLVALLLFSLGTLAQTRTTQGTQIIVALEAKKNEILALYPLATIKKDKKALQKCSSCTYYLGELKGSYDQNGIRLRPKAEATITIFTEQEVFAEQVVFPEKEFQAKKEVVLGTAKATVVANKKGELILKAKSK